MARSKRAAAEAAGDKIKAVLEWETLPESSKQFKQYAAQIDAEFAAEQKSKRVRIEDVDEADNDSLSDDMSCVGQNGDDIPNEDDKAFIEEDHDYNSEDTDYVTAAEDVNSAESSECDDDDDENDDENDEDEIDEGEATEEDVDNDVSDFEDCASDADDTTDTEKSKKENENTKNVKHDEEKNTQNAIDDKPSQDTNVATWPEHMSSLPQTYICWYKHCIHDLFCCVY